MISQSINLPGVVVWILHHDPKQIGHQFERLRQSGHIGHLCWPGIGGRDHKYNDSFVIVDRFVRREYGTGDHLHFWELRWWKLTGTIITDTGLSHAGDGCWQVAGHGSWLDRHETVLFLARQIGGRGWWSGRRRRRRRWRRGARFGNLTTIRVHHRILGIIPRRTWRRMNN